MSEAMDRWELAATRFDAVIQSAQADQWKTPSNCEGWLARDIVVHVVGNHRGTAAQATGGEPTGISGRGAGAGGKGSAGGAGRVGSAGLCCGLSLLIWILRRARGGRTAGR